MIPRDTTAEAHAAQAAVLRRLGPDGRVRIAVEMNEATRQIAVEGVLPHNPELSDAEALRLVSGAPTSHAR